MSKTKSVFFAALMVGTAAFGSVFDDAKFWWKFDNGGADGAVVQTSEIHDVRDASVGAATRTCGPSGGPVWTNTAVHLSYRQKTVQCTALDMQVVTNVSKQIRPTMVDIGGGYVHSDTATFFARICPGEQLYTTTGERFIYNNNFNYGSDATNAYGNLFGVARNGAKYSPILFIGRRSKAFYDLTLETGKWYDLAFSISMVTGATQRTLCVVAGENGIFYQTHDFAFERKVAFAGNTGRFGGQSFVNSWQNIGTTSIVNCKDFNGLVHEMALWDRGLNLGEILDVFGRPEVPEGGDVYSDVYRWWKFDRDLDDDGKVSANELRDVRKWGTAAAPAADNPTVSYLTDGGPLSWQNMSVFQPALGKTFSADCLVMEPEYRTQEDGSYQIWPARVRLDNSTVGGDSTVIARICITKPYDFISGDKACYVLNNSFDWGNTTDLSGGYEIGILALGNNTTNFYPRYYAGRSATYATSLKMTTNTWYDIAWTFSPQADGNDHLTVTVADAKDGIRTWSGTMPTSQSKFLAKTLSLGGESDLRTWSTYSNGAGTVLSAGNAAKNFTGAIQQLAIWKRVLTKDEIAAAFGYPRAAFGVGTADGSSGEFATAAEGSYDWTASETWHDMAGTLDSSHRALTVRFTMPPSWEGMDQGFHLVAGNVAGTDTKVSFSINGAGFGAQAATTGKDMWWIVKGGAIHAGENIAVLRISGEAGASVAVDKMEMLGSWGLVSGVGGSFTHEGEIAIKDFYVGDRDMTHIARAVTSGNPSNRLHFWLPAYLAENYPFEFTFRTVDNANSSAAFEFVANGEVVHSEPNGLINGEKTIAFAPGELKAGWNEIGPRYLSGGGAWVQWNRYFLRMRGPELGTFLMFR